MASLENAPEKAGRIEFFGELTAEQRQLLEVQWSDVVGRLEALTAPQEEAGLNISFKYEEEPQELQKQYGTPIVAHYRQKESGNEIVVHERFFNKSENERVYILTHELSHALSEIIFSQDDAQALFQLCRQTTDDCETRYVLQLKEAVKAGKISEQQYFSEQIAERLTAYQLGEGKLSKMLAVHAMYSPNSEAIFEGVPEQIRQNENELENYLLTADDVNPTIAHFRHCHALFETALSRGGAIADDLGEYFDDEFVELESLGQSELLETYVKSSANRQSGQRQGLWDFLVWLFSTERSLK